MSDSHEPMCDPASLKPGDIIIMHFDDMDDVFFVLSNGRTKMFMMILNSPLVGRRGCKFVYHHRTFASDFLHGGITIIHA